MRCRPLWMRVVWVLLAVALSGPWAAARGQNCAGGGAPRPDEGGIGGTGVAPQRPADEGGIGGTGVQGHIESAEGGVVGSGVTAGNRIGVIGTITGFASICVGELEIHYDASTPIEVDGIKASVAALAVGQVVEVVASDSTDGSGTELRAQRIASHHVVAGPIRRLDSSTNTMTVLGQAVHVVASTRVEANPDAGPLALAEGGLVRVSGMRRADGVIIASRISPLEENAPARLSGSVAKVEGGRFEVSGVPVQLQGSPVPNAGTEVRVVGAWDGALLQAQLVEPLSRLPFEGRLARVEVEGFARRSSRDTMQVGGFEIQVPKQAWERGGNDFGDSDTRLRVQAVVRDNHLVAERIVPAREPRPAAMERGPLGVPGSSDGRRSKESEGLQGLEESDIGLERQRQPGAASGADASNDLDRELRPREAGGAARVAPGAEWSVEQPQGERPLAERPQREAPPQIERPLADRPQVERPAMERPQRPELPQRPQLPILPERPPRPERPQPPESRPR